MPQFCSVCRHPEKLAIEGAVLRNEPLRSIAQRLGTSPWAIHRHKKHLPKQLAEARHAEQVAEATGLLNRVEALLAEAEKIAAAAKESRDWSAATSALREARSCLELLGRLRGELQTGTNVKVAVGVQVNPRETPPANMEELETKIALEIAALTDGYDARAIARFRALAEAAAPTIINASLGRDSAVDAMISAS